MTGCRSSGTESSSLSGPTSHLAGTLVACQLQVSVACNKANHPCFQRGYPDMRFGRPDADKCTFNTSMRTFEEVCSASTSTRTFSSLTTLLTAFFRSCLEMSPFTVLLHGPYSFVYVQNWKRGLGLQVFLLNTLLICI